MDQDGTNERQITSDPANDLWPDWSPDGTKIAFSSLRSGNWDIWVAAVDVPPVPPTYRALAEHWAPVIYQDTDNTCAIADYITRFDFDTVDPNEPDFDGTNNWENLSNDCQTAKFNPDAYVYYWVVETPTNWFIGYALFHPRDWTELCSDLFCHENDMEGILLTVARDGSKFGQFLLMNTRVHYWFNSYQDKNALPSSDVTGAFNCDKYDADSDQCIEGYDDVQFEADHPLIYVEAKGHPIRGAKRWETDGFPGGDGVKYIYTGTPEMPNSGNETRCRV